MHYFPFLQNHQMMIITGVFLVLPLCLQCLVALFDQQNWDQPEIN